MKIDHPYLEKVYEKICRKHPGEREYLQTVYEIFETIVPVMEVRSDLISAAVAERLVEPERCLSFRVCYVDDQGKIQVHNGYRFQCSSAIGPYKGGIRFHPSVNASIMKFLSLEQTLKNALTGLPMGGAKGGADFDPKGKSDGEIMRFCQAYMTELYRHVGADVDVPAGDIGVGAREIGYMFGMYKKLKNEFNGVFTGKSLSYGGSLGRKEATGYGLCYFTRELLKDHYSSMEGKRIVVSGSGNVAIYTAEKAICFGGKVVAMSDSSGYILDEEGIDPEIIKKIKEKDRKRISEYTKYVSHSTFVPVAQDIWTVPCDIAFPCATQNELDGRAAFRLLENKVEAVVEGANMPCTPEAIAVFQNSSVLFAPSKAANAGGVSVSGLEMTQNAMRLSWSLEEVDRKLEQIMKNIYETVRDTAKKYGMEGNLVAGANIAGFLKVADAMMWQGVC